MHRIHLDLPNQEFISKYRQLVKKWTHCIKVKNQVKFFKRCLEEQVIPSSFGHIKEASFSGEPFATYQKTFIEHRIAQAQDEISHAYFQLRHAQSSLREGLQANAFEGAMRRAGEVAYFRGIQHYQNLEVKINRLCRASAWNKVGETNQVLNLSSFPLNNDHLTLLNLGLNFSLGPDKNFLVKSLASINNHNYYYPEEKLNLLKGSVLSIELNKNEFSIPKRHKQALDELARNKDIKIMKADKGGSVVVMDTIDYNVKALRLLNDQNTYIELPHIPSIKSLQGNFNKKLKAIASRIPDKESRDIVCSKVSKKTPNIPYFYGIPKAHKNGCPLRPIVATCGAPQSQLANWLAKQLSPLIGTISTSHIQHNTDFINKLRTLGDNVSGHMYSLDVTSLFTNVPLNYVLDRLKHRYENDLTFIHFTLPLGTNLLTAA